MQRKMRILLTFVVLMTCTAFAAYAEAPLAEALNSGCQTSALDAILSFEEQVMTPVTKVDADSPFKPLGFCGWNCDDANINGRRCSGSQTTTCTTSDGLCSFCFCQSNGYYLCLT